MMGTIGSRRFAFIIKIDDRLISFSRLTATVDALMRAAYLAASYTALGQLLHPPSLPY